MKKLMDSQENDLDSSPGKSLNGSFRKTKSGTRNTSLYTSVLLLDVTDEDGFSQNDMDSSPGQSLDGSFRKSNSVISVQSLSGMSTPSKKIQTSRKLLKAMKDYGKRLANLELFVEGLEEWVLENSHRDVYNDERSFRSPFSIDELCKLDLALEGVLFQQLYRMPCLSQYPDHSTVEERYFAMEDFLHTIMNGLWRTFWRKSEPLPFSLCCPRHPRSKFYTLDKAISKGRVEELCGLALVSKAGSHDMPVHWDKVVEFALFREDILSGNELKLSSASICEALFYGFHILVARSLSKCSLVGSNSVFVLVFDSRFGGVVKLGGDLSKLDVNNSSNAYESVFEWIKHHAEVSVSSVDHVWNKLGNASWGDIGTLQVILATFYSMVQWNGLPRKSIASLAAHHSLRLQKRRMEFHHHQQQLDEDENARQLLPFQHRAHHGEIVEVEQQNEDVGFTKKASSRLKLRQGDIVVLDDPKQGHKSFLIQDSLVGGNHFLYNAFSQDLPTQLLSLYVGAHPSRLEPSWEDMSLWYQVQRQTKVLNILNQQGGGCKYLPEIVAWGRILHSGPCKKQNAGGRCDHPWCGTPILVTCPVGEPLSRIVGRGNVPFSQGEALRCCRDCLAALRTAAAANVLHGDLCPDNIIKVKNNSSSSSSLYVPISWGRAVLEDRDRPAINLQFSSSHALQHGKLCPSSDAESLIYLMYYICGGTMEQQDSIESALQWREGSWAKRSIQQVLGEVSPLLKAFADYVDSLCGTPYPVDFDIWLTRLNKAVQQLDDDDGNISIPIPTANPLSLSHPLLLPHTDSNNNNSSRGKTIIQQQQRQVIEEELVQLQLQLQLQGAAIPFPRLEYVAESSGTSGGGGGAAGI
ncbi:hypothetical protein Tsubulata_025262 [Turnera subulata]|uniref:Protein kinase domain-containing protein n=1 Tax=Turnera subulata TaxID=218843 RepID=A0A9Q0G6J9_9ROSI|nr:hypothetical protein Tsubulata_025262 [Turnera subulata]